MFWLSQNGKFAFLKRTMTEKNHNKNLYFMFKIWVTYFVVILRDKNIGDEEEDY